MNLCRVPVAQATRNGKPLTDTGPFVRDPPRPGIDQVDGALLLDVDGVLNILGDAEDQSGLPSVTGSRGRPLPINMISGEILDVLEHTLRRPGVWLGWLTTWGSSVASLEKILGGRLSGGFVVAERPSGYYAPADWKYKGAFQFAEKHPRASVAWVDDDAIPITLQTRSLSSQLSGLVRITPQPDVGLTLSHARQIEKLLTISPTSQ